MFKSLLNWLIGVEPISRWLLLIMLLGMIIGAGFTLKYYGRKSEKEL